MKFGQRSLDSLKGVHPDLVKVMTEAIKTSQYDFTITDGVRTTEKQKALYAQGRTVPGNIVTNTDGVKKKSNHQPKQDGFGYAVDLYPFVNGKVDLNDKVKLLPIIAKHILDTAISLNIKIEWGGSWKSIIDKPHFELKK